MDTHLQFFGLPTYTVETDVYQGPLDLLLHLIERAELDITKVALAQITNPFLEYVRQLQNHQGEEVSVFLVMAARLMQIKSEALLPHPPVREPGEEDPGEELIRQLIAYKRYKEIAQILKEKNEAGLRTYLKGSPPLKIESKLDLSNLSITDLLNAAVLVFSIAADQQPLDVVVKAPAITIKDKISQITWFLKSSRKSSFRKLLSSQYTRAEIIVTFLALLELVKSFRVRAFQDQLFGEINIEVEESWETDDDIEFAFIE